VAGLFSRIIQGEIPCYKIHEDEHSFAFLARDQIRPGHTLVVPKTEVDHFLDVPEPYYGAVWAAAKPIGKAIQAATGCPRIGAMVLGMEVPHFHLVPIDAEAQLSFAHAKVLDDATMEELRGKIVAALG